jgi:hypothetical protein
MDWLNREHTKKNGYKHMNPPPKKKKKLRDLSPQRTIRTERPPLSAKLAPTFAHWGCCVVSATDPHGRIFGVLDQSHYYFFQVALKLYSQGWVDPVPDSLLRRKSDGMVIEPGTGTLTTRPQRWWWWGCEGYVNVVKWNEGKVGHGEMSVH